MINLRKYTDPQPKQFTSSSIKTYFWSAMIIIGSELRHRSHQHNSVLGTPYSTKSWTYRYCMCCRGSERVIKKRKPHYWLQAENEQGIKARLTENTQSHKQTTTTHVQPTIHHHHLTNNHNDIQYLKKTSSSS